MRVTQNMEPLRTLRTFWALYAESMAMVRIIYEGSCRAYSDCQLALGDQLCRGLAYESTFVLSQVNSVHPLCWGALAFCSPFVLYLQAQVSDSVEIGPATATQHVFA